MTIGRRGVLAGGAAALAVPARADTYPSKQIRWVIPFAPGEPSLFERGLRAARDLITRLFGRWPVVPGGPLA